MNWGQVLITICALQQIVFIRQTTDLATGKATQKCLYQFLVIWGPHMLVSPLDAEFGTKEDDQSRQLMAGEIADINRDNACMV